MPRIDTHHHFVPLVFKRYAEKQSEWPSPAWNLEGDLKFCKKHDIGISILSLTTPGTGAADTIDGSVDIAKDANDSAANIRDQKSDRYGFFASLPPPVGTDGLAAALTELKRAFDELGADGVTLMTTYDGKYLGHESFVPLWNELNKREAVVFVHPTSPKDWHPINSQLLAPIADFAWETTRTALDLITSHTLDRHAHRCKIILSHAGGCLPWIWKRPAVLLPGLATGDSMSTEKFQELAKAFWFDTALSGDSEIIGLLMNFAKKERILYGSDYPYADEESIKTFTGGLDDTEMSDKMRERINWRNALDLFPRLQTAPGNIKLPSD